MTGDNVHMARAIMLARLGTGKTSPNPLVGAVIVRDNKIISEGWHTAYGAPHAEAEAIEKAGAEARGATLYCNLEPCCHRTPEKLTPPCTDRIINAGIRRVVFAVRDPNPHVAGLGQKTLEDAGVETSSGVASSAALLLNEPFVAWIQRRLPYVHLKIAQTLDGRIAAPDGSAQWISSEPSRVAVHEMRARYDAVLVGSATVQTDNPSLTVRHIEGRNPARIIVDTGLTSLRNARVLSDAAAPTFLACSSQVAERASGFAPHVGLIACRLDARGRVDLDHLIEQLPEYGITSVLVEGGGAIASSFIRAGLVDRLTVFTNPSLMGAGVPWLQDISFGSATERPRLERVIQTRSGDDVLVSGLMNTKRTYGTLEAPEVIDGVLPWNITGVE
ncbi:MAG: bifunctional diaminohydroxyphosphoribosylaminopyrimidine deaminase/5-amino-6-(5-phosphoribosylamino)uracil reductase RibD [Spirochaetota bacterium]